VNLRYLSDKLPKLLMHSQITTIFIDILPGVGGIGLHRIFAPVLVSLRFNRSGAFEPTLCLNEPERKNN